MVDADGFHCKLEDGVGAIIVDREPVGDVAVDLADKTGTG
jgi:hypothetical protein